uniref:Uncharacterized protein n=1 Tax=Caenorhabditis japonica TaxID=281687 RepID=A0A8R1HJB1_CAEJA
MDSLKQITNVLCFLACSPKASHPRIVLGFHIMALMQYTTALIDAMFCYLNETSYLRERDNTLFAFWMLGHSGYSFFMVTCTNLKRKSCAIFLATQLFAFVGLLTYAYKLAKDDEDEYYFYYTQKIAPISLFFIAFLSGSIAFTMSKENSSLHPDLKHAEVWEEQN